MKYVAGLIALICLAGCATVSAPDRDADIQALTEAKVETWRQIYRDSDAAGLAAFLDDKFVFIPGGGDPLSKNDEVTYLRENDVDMAPDFQFHVEDIIFTGPDSAIVYGIGKSTRENDDGQPCAHSYRSSNTLIRKNGNWHPVFSHVSGAKCEVIK